MLYTIRADFVVPNFRIGYAYRSNRRTYIAVYVVSIVSIVVGKARASIVCTSQTRFHIDLLGMNNRLASMDQFGA